MYLYKNNRNFYTGESYIPASDMLILQQYLRRHVLFLACSLHVSYFYKADMYKLYIHLWNMLARSLYRHHTDVLSDLFLIPS